MNLFEYRTKLVVNHQRAHRQNSRTINVHFLLFTAANSLIFAFFHRLPNKFPQWAH